ncbi:transglycosylase SLT domain-containing protein [Nocardia terpenica]|uniref:transglycosylase SLT domain-containing protein n=1 Tax=Nocardia terpenica TaxID=455432 RepID=UPI001893FF4A|nr:transglycosylase SLT domain-containing protein [Nocardia terpenica]MBF6060692.1 transglycosylase SLT domain-containing protein [Nocardia terpenica]MBF6103952.1 transglycosylase SLT domain-containing protein [Nocardia terpenica]MBF6111674.1 transglycosylase SLT domain-containing protein [Nocardia terpenica]MBF6118173.1 transglycosylase SLT domain-containing protein [Nocardia terpenica]MBF6156433.1 transglycosylase SLT domain-containing protein [Nocardia terpenica]
MSNSPKSSRAKAVARTAGSAALALTAFAAITSAGGHRTDEVRPVALASTIAATAAPAADVHSVAAPIPGPAPLPILPPLPALPILPPPPPPPVYPDNLDGWIHHALDIMTAHGIPGSYDGIYRNVMRESSGNPRAINLYDSNAAAGIPSKGLLQVIDPTFQAFHVDGTAWDIYDPVANIAAACNYAASRYGSMDNVDSAY